MSNYATPTGVPHAVCPKLDKLDLPALKQDIPTYTPWISSAAAAEWATFLENDIPDLSPPSEDAHGWIMEEVFSSASTPHTPHETAEAAVEINADLASMFAAEQATCEV